MPCTAAPGARGAAAAKEPGFCAAGATGPPIAERLLGGIALRASSIMRSIRTRMSAAFLLSSVGRGAAGAGAAATMACDRGGGGVGAAPISGFNSMP